MSIDLKNLYSRLKDKTLYKLSASGNDFIFLLNLDKEIDADAEGPTLAKALCRPKFSVSADGFILVEKTSSPETQFSWRFFNSD
ncbi:MAG: diaminopimelate epimerase, partial [Caldimicrobium sp.]|nr:diaminopimelate epimerase [Caldimicrobium sp.]